MKRLIMTEQEKNRILEMHKGAILSEQAPNTNTDVADPKNNTGKIDFTKMTADGRPVEKGGLYWVLLFGDKLKGPELSTDKKIGTYNPDTNMFTPNGIGKQNGFNEPMQGLPENTYTMGLDRLY